MSEWRPTFSLHNLALRAQLLSQVRHFFNERDVLEVETPLVCARTVTEPNIASFYFSINDDKRYLQTSPEYAMKRLLAAGAPDIFQICKSFRDGEQGTLHNPEFTMIEWYRLGYSLDEIMRETVDLISTLLLSRNTVENVDYVSYNDLTKKSLGVSLCSLSEDSIKNLAVESGLVIKGEMSLGQYIDFIFSHKVMSAMSANAITVVFHYPAAQAALSKLNTDDPSLAERFEVFYEGVELANGYVELTDVNVQLERFESDQAVRQVSGLPEVAIDERLIEAQRHGLPECAGVAVGFDRVMMLAAGASSLAEVMSFDWSNA